MSAEGSNNEFSSQQQTLSGKEQKYWHERRHSTHDNIAFENYEYYGHSVLKKLRPDLKISAPKHSRAKHIPACRFLFICNVKLFWECEFIGLG